MSRPRWEAVWYRVQHEPDDVIQLRVCKEPYNRIMDRTQHAIDRTVPAPEFTSRPVLWRLRDGT